MLGVYLVPRTFKAGELLWHEGDTNGMLVSLVEGRVKIYRLLPNGNSVTNYLFGPGDLFGFMPLFDDAPYPAYRIEVERRAGVDIDLSDSKCVIHNRDGHEQRSSKGIFRLRERSRRKMVSTSSFSTWTVHSQPVQRLDQDHQVTRQATTRRSHRKFPLMRITPR